MKAALFPRLAVDSMKKNRRLYRPYLLTCVLMVMIHYILNFLSRNELLDYMSGGGTLQWIMALGSWVIGVFSLLFLFYTHAFLFRRRKKELGLYNILGMEKKHIGFLVFWESLICAAVALAVGLLLGVGLSKLAELGLVNLVRGDVTYDFRVSLPSLRRTASVFGMIFGLVFLQGLWQVFRAKPVELLRSENVGEKPPKANWFLGIAGVAILGLAYWMALSIEDPLDAMIWFFVAVILVIAATYLLFVCGSVVLCRLLQKNKRYYYQPNHFVSVSSMTYRMKRNGAGLASICILGTMVLVMLAASSCLYIGTEDSLRSQHPWDMAVRVELDGTGATDPELLSELRQIAEEELENVAVTRRLEYCYGRTEGFLTDGVLDPDKPAENGESRYCYLRFLELSDYNRMTGSAVTLEPGQALAWGMEGLLTVRGGASYTIVGQPEGELEASLQELLTDETALLVVPDLDAARITDRTWRLLVNLDEPDEAQIRLQERLNLGIQSLVKQREGGYSYWVQSIAADRGEFYGSYGGLFFLGLLLSAVFLFAAVLIIYYKQISEGFEDQPRFSIMRKVGMTDREIRRSINSQLLTVFFLPLLGAVLHLSFAFPMLRRMLVLFSVTNTPLLLATAGVSVLIFSVFYLIVYRLTSNAYYSIVSTN